MVMVLLDTGPTLYKLVAKTVIATEQHRLGDANSEVSPRLLSPHPLNDLG